MERTGPRRTFSLHFDGVKLIDSQKPDLAFLDIQLPVYTSFEILEKIKHHPHVIFITAYDEYAIKAFEANAVDYLLKPTSQERLIKAIERVQGRSPQNQDLLTAIQTILKKDQFRERITIKVGNDILFIPVNDIYWFHADDKYVFLHTFDHEYLLEDTLKNLETCLNPESFIRVHKSLIINTLKINRIKRNLTGQYQIQLNDSKKTNLGIGRTYLTDVRVRLNF